MCPKCARLNSIAGPVDNDGLCSELATVIEASRKVHGSNKAQAQELRTVAQPLPDAEGKVNGDMRSSAERESQAARQSVQQIQAAPKWTAGGDLDAHPRSGASAPAPPSTGGEERRFNHWRKRRTQTKWPQSWRAKYVKLNLYLIGVVGYNRRNTICVVSMRTRCRIV